MPVSVPTIPYALSQGNSEQSLTLWFRSVPMQSVPSLRLTLLAAP